MQHQILPPRQFQQLLGFISRLQPCTAFVFNYQEQTGVHAFGLLVFSANGNPGISASAVANTIYEQSGKDIQPVLLLHRITDLKTGQPHLQRFFNTILKEGQRICFDKNAYPFLPINEIPSRDANSDLAFWHKCIAVAQFNINAAEASGHLEVELCKIALLHTACVQIALGLIRMVLEYTPNEFGLKYLLGLCALFTDIPSKIFQSQNPNTMHRYKMLCAPPSLLNHRIKLNANETDFLFLLEATKQFQNLATELISKIFSQKN